MKKNGWLKSMTHPGDQVLEVLRFFGVASEDAWRAQYAAPVQAAFRASAAFDKQAGSVGAWLRKAEIEATALTCAPFSKPDFRAALDQLRDLTNEPSPQVFVPKLVETCAAAGVAVVLVPAPPRCPVSGATKWLAPDKALLVLSLRHRTNDHLWFTFFHEAAHLILHGKKLLFIEGNNGLDSSQEEEANRFAADLLLPPSTAARLELLRAKRGFSMDDVCAFASEVGVAPGIVVGRMQKEGWLPWTHMNSLKVSYAWS